MPIIGHLGLSLDFGYGTWCQDRRVIKCQSFTTIVIGGRTSKNTLSLLCCVHFRKILTVYYRCIISDEKKSDLLVFTLNLEGVTK